jgi:hypothetical protein
LRVDIYCWSLNDTAEIDQELLLKQAELDGLFQNPELQSSPVRRFHISYELIGLKNSNPSMISVRFSFIQVYRAGSTYIRTYLRRVPGGKRLIVR